MAAASDSSTKKVDWPARIRSLAPRRVKMRSMGDRRTLSPGTKHPSCAMMDTTQQHRSSVDLPPMFGPVSSSIRAASGASSPPPPSLASLGMASWSRGSTRQGCRTCCSSSSTGAFPCPVDEPPAEEEEVLTISGRE